MNRAVHAIICQVSFIWKHLIPSESFWLLAEQIIEVELMFNLQQALYNDGRSSKCCPQVVHISQQAGTDSDEII